MEWIEKLANNLIAKNEQYQNINPSTVTSLVKLIAESKDRFDTSVRSIREIIDDAIVCERESSAAYTDLLHTNSKPSNWVAKLFKLNLENCYYKKIVENLPEKELAEWQATYDQVENIVSKHLPIYPGRWGGDRELRIYFSKCREHQKTFRKKRENVRNELYEQSLQSDIDTLKAKIEEREKDYLRAVDTGIQSNIEAKEKLLKMTRFSNLVYIDFLLSLSDMKSKVGVPETTTKKWALYYRLLIENNIKTELLGNKKELMRIADDKGISRQNFYQAFLAFRQGSDKDPAKNPENFKLVISELSNYPEIQKKAKQELEKMLEKE